MYLSVILLILSGMAGTVAARHGIIAPAPMAFLHAPSSARTVLGARQHVSPMLSPPLRHGVALRAAEEDEDFTDRAFDFFSSVATTLNKDVNVPSFLVPLRPNQKGSTTTLQGWWLFASGVSLIFGNVLFPATFLGFLYVSRPVDAPDAAAAAAAVLTSAIVSPIFSSIVDALEADDWPLAKLPLLLGLVTTAVLLKEMSQEGQASFVKPVKEIKDPQKKSERDLKFFDVKLRTSEGKKEPAAAPPAPKKEVQQGGGSVGGSASAAKKAPSSGSGSKTVMKEDTPAVGGGKKKEEQPVPPVRRREEENKRGGGRWR